MSPPLQLPVVSHTHWDREWYLPFERFRMRLVRLVDGLIDLLEATPAFTHFMLDGQTSVLEDYLEVRPEQRERLARLIRDGRVGVGPWYVLPDEFLVSGEALIRNLQLGRRMAKALGRCMEVGYAPDQFGHLAQLPELFAGFGMTSAVLWRGVPREVQGTTFTWRALSGRELFCLWLPTGYGNAAKLPEDLEQTLGRIRQELDRTAPRRRGGTYLLMNGSDHLPPDAHLPSLLPALNQQLAGEAVLVHTTLEAAVAQARELAPPSVTVQGELRAPDFSHLLPGVLSARTYLKVRNERCQRLLERYAEPLSALGVLFGTVAQDARPLLQHAWKVLLQNHPHDSICGCSVDEVHREMEVRFARSESVTAKLVDEQLAGLCGESDEHDDDLRQGALAVFNPLPRDSREPAEVELLLDARDGALPAFRLRAEDGQPVPFELLSRAPAVRIVNRTPLYPLNVPAFRVRLRLQAPLPPLGVAVLRLEAATGEAPAVVGATPAGAIENAWLRVAPIPGGFEVLHKATGVSFLHRLEDVADRGDEYNFDPVPGDGPLSSQTFAEPATLTVRQSALGAELQAEGAWDLPASLDASRDARAAARSRSPYVWRARLHAGSSRVDFVLEVDHRAADHRLRARFEPRGGVSDVLAETAFGFLRRPLTPASRMGPEVPTTSHPVLARLLIEQDGRPLAGLGLPGLHEYERDPRGVSVTLLRAVGFLSRDDLRDRDGDAGPMLATPEAQCAGAARLRYCLVVDPDAGADGLAGALEQALLPPHALPLRGASAPSRAHLAVERGELSCLKPADQGEGVVLRTFSPLSASAANARWLRGPPSARPCDLSEDPLEASDTAPAGRLSSWRVIR